MQKEWFESWFDSPWYSSLYDNRSQEEAADFVDKLLQWLQPAAGSRMLDIACGEGRHSLQLASYGHEVTGIDLAEKMIAAARTKENEHTHFYVHDMRFPFYINYFDYAFNFFTSFGYFERKRDHHMAADTFAAALKSGGCLVVDYLNKAYTEERLVPQETLLKHGIEFEIRRFVEDGKFVKQIHLVDTEGVPHHYQERVSAFGLEDFRDLFRESGLHLEHIFGDYQLGAYDASASPRMIMVFRKK